MAVLEICQLRIRPRFAPADRPLLHALQNARTELRERVINTHSRFYQAMDDPYLIYIFGVWPSVERHEEFLASSERGEILDSQEEYFEFGWLMHIDLGEGGMEKLPLKAPVLSFGKLETVDGGGKGKLDEAWVGYERLMLEASKPFPVCSGWRMDGKGDKDEFLVISGWGDELAWGYFREDAKAELETLKGLLESSGKEEVRQMLDMEGVI